MKRILITGGAGFVGRNLCNHLAKNYKVIVIDDLSSGYLKYLNSKIIFIKGTLNNKKILTKAFKFKPQYVIHLAALFANQNSVENPKKDLNVNGLGIINLFEFCKVYKVKKIIYSSSSCVYGNSSNMKESNTNLNPSTPYAITKLVGEYYSKFWSEYYNLNIIVIRLFNVYGPGDLPGKFRSVVPNFFYNAINNKTLIITGNGDETRDYTFIKDVVLITEKLLTTKTKKFDIINIGSGKSTKILKIAKKINKITKNTKKITFIKARKWDDVINRKSNNKKLKYYFKSFKFTNLNDGLIETYNWFKKI